MYKDAVVDPLTAMNNAPGNYPECPFMILQNPKKKSHTSQIYTVPSLQNY